MGRGIIDIDLSGAEATREGPRSIAEPEGLYYSETGNGARLLHETGGGDVEIVRLDLEDVADRPMEERFELLYEAMESVDSDDTSDADGGTGYDSLVHVPGIDEPIEIVRVNADELPEYRGIPVGRPGDVGGNGSGGTENGDADGKNVPDALGAWSQRITETMPIEIVTGWATIEAIIQTQQEFPIGVHVAIFVFLVPTVPFLIWGSLDEKPKTVDQWAKVHTQWLIAVSAFLVWVYYLGGPFERAGSYSPAIAAILLVLWGITTLAFAQPIGLGIKKILLRRSGEQGRRGG